LCAGCADVARGWTLCEMVFEGWVGEVVVGRGVIAERPVVMTKLIRDAVEVILGGTKTGLHAKAAGGLGAGIGGVGGG
jgi:hypothetical protein